MTRGRAVQVGSPEALFERPAHTFVGHFIGSPGMNFLPTTCSASTLTVAGVNMPLPAALQADISGTSSIKLGVRPEYLQLVAANSAGALPAQVQQLQDIGTYTLLTAKIGDSTVKARLSPDTATPAVGSTVWLQVLGPHTCYYRNDLLINPHPSAQVAA
jgi:glycerol transport system ATP-binding protein